eukprot:TRINITY_DN2129_c0_g1_i1.p1 TRINITY_DN2129_c0_g1~~TRINITY_DN2129_c0_g1_i1.p1  ORF type:complete len:637 (-),score=33.16 TRINITY_DN2129_c0_g1_i1:47-1738(-)
MEDKPIHSSAFSSQVMVDILSNHLHPLLKKENYSLTCRLVCRTWRDAFSSFRLTFRPEELEKEDFQHYKNVIFRAHTVSFDYAKLRDLKPFLDLVPSCSLLSKLDINFQNLDKNYAEAFCTLMGMNLPRLKSFEVGCHNASPPETWEVASSALESTNLRMKKLTVSCSRLGGLRGAGIILALRRNTTVERLSLVLCSLTSHSLDALSILLRENTTITSLNLYYNMDLFRERSSSEAFGAALATNSTLRDLQIRSCGLYYSDGVYPALRCNMGLRKLQIDFDLTSADRDIIIFECLETNTSLISLDVSFSVAQSVPGALGNMFLKNSTLQELRCVMNRVESLDFTPMYEGLRRNESITSLSFVHANQSLAQTLSDAMLANPSLPLRSLRLTCFPAGSASVDCILRASETLMKLETLELSGATVGHDSAADFATLIEKSTSLARLSLHEHRFDSATMSQILESVPKSCSLNELNLGGTQDKVVEVHYICALIASNPYLTVLDLNGALISIRSKPEFESALRKNSRMLKLEVNFYGEDENLDIDESQLEWTGNLRLSCPPDQTVNH